MKPVCTLENIKLACTNLYGFHPFDECVRTKGRVAETMIKIVNKFINWQLWRSSWNANAEVLKSAPKREHSERDDIILTTFWSAKKFTQKSETILLRIILFKWRNNASFFFFRRNQDNFGLDFPTFWNHKSN